MENLNVLFPDLTEEQQGKGARADQSFGSVTLTTVSARAVMSHQNLFPLKHAPSISLLVTDRPVGSSQLFHGLLIRPWACPCVKLGARRRLCCALNA